MTKNQGPSFDEGLPEKLEYLANEAEQPYHLPGGVQVIPAAGVAGVLRGALDEINYHRKVKALRERAEAAWRALQAEVGDE